MSNTIKIRRGSSDRLPRLEIGELALTTDENVVYIGAATGNVRVSGYSSSGNRSSKMIKCGVYIPQSAWRIVENSAYYVAEIADSDVTNASVVTVHFKALDVMGECRNAGIIKPADTEDGSFSIYAAKIPEKDFVVKIEIDKG